VAVQVMPTFTESRLPGCPPIAIRVRGPEMIVATLPPLTLSTSLRPASCTSVTVPCGPE
jgi:hypothetical protein